MGATTQDLSHEPLAGRPCLVCAAPVRLRVAAWTAQCPSCGTWRSDLEPEIESASLHRAIDTGARSEGLRELRERNNRRILDEIAALQPLEGKRLIDVGSAHGWFLEAAATRGLDAAGIEPEDAIAEHARAAGHRVRSGYFPAVLEPGEQADVITFNDVLEHIPDVDETLRACAQTLRPGGVLSINIPSATGLGYRVATLLGRLGVKGPYERFWQYGLPSPHAHYFTPEALATLVRRHGLILRRTVPLSSVQRRGLWARLHTIERPSVRSVIAFVGLWVAAPILDRPANSDIVLVLAQRAAEEPSRGV
ncbi:MAG: class I SAM-dependent methyltransferase [Solirubrobacteraceae bacterium]|nr:class I SAM-dependent methyltransferase [Patulibacter sp.]